MVNIRQFVRESNLIEGIKRSETDKEAQVTEVFLRLSVICTDDLWNLVKVYAPGHRLRDVVGLNVRVGRHVAPPGGPDIRGGLEVLLEDISTGVCTDPYLAHCAYLTLHPFTDGNGRSGRALWAWHMYKVGRDPFELPFLHRFYYQALEHADGR